MSDLLELKQFEFGAEGQYAPAKSVDMFAASYDKLKNFLRRQWKLIALALITGIALGVTGLAVIPAKYQATATMLIDKPRLNFFPQHSVVSDPAFENHEVIAGQLEILKSDIIAKKVIEKLNLDQDADFALPQWASNSFTAAQWERHLLEVFGRLRGVKLIGAGFAVEISFQSHSAEIAAAAANAIADAYLVDMRTWRRAAVRDAGDWLQDRLAELRTQAAQAEHAVVDFRMNNDIVDTGGNQIVGQQINDVSSQLTKARIQLSEVSARLDRAQVAAREYATATVKPAMTELANNSLTNKLLEQYFQLSSLAADYAKRFGAEHMATVKLRQRAEEVRIGLINDLERLSQTLLSEKTILERHVQDLERALNTAVGTSRTQEAAQVKLHELESIAQSYRALYDGLLSRHSEAVVQEEQPISGARIISPALEPISKVMKKPLLISALLALGATGLGLALSLLRDLKDRTFRTGDDIEQMLRSEFIGMIPTWRSGLHPAARAGRALIVANASANQHVLRKNSVYWALMLAPTSAFAEAIGRVKFAILRQSNDEGRIIGLTSVLPNEGASTVASAVVQSLAKSGRSVILVDCDLRHPELTKEIAAHAKVGLQEILFGDARLDDAILTDAASGFAFLPGVLGGLRARPEELLETDALAEVLIELRQRYEYVVVDLPPMFPMLDVSMTDRLIEGYIVVVEWGSSKIDTVAHALARCPGVRSRMLGLVLNKVDFNRISLYDHRMADYYDPARYSNYLLKNSAEHVAHPR